MKLTIFVLLSLATLCATNSKRGCGSKKGECYDYVQQNQKQNCCDQNPIINPCSTVKCANDTECVVHYTPDPRNCTTDFPTTTRCDAPCPIPKCASYCVPTRNFKQCPDCYCDEKDPPKNPCIEADACGKNEECVLQEVICKKAPCLPVKQCRAKCEPVSVCPKNCYRYKDQFGCEKCHCCNDCVNKECAAGTKCKLNIVQCFTCPCPPLAECV